MAVTSGQVLGNNQPQGGKDSRFYVNWTLVSQSVANNTSTINWQAGWYFVLADRQLDDGDLTIDGSLRWNDGGRLYDYVGNFTTRYQQEASGSYTINHDTDGTKTFNINGSILGYLNARSTGSANFTLPTIPRYATINSFTVTNPTKSSLKFNVTVSDVCDLLEYSTNNGASYTSVSGTYTSKSVTVTGLAKGTTYNCKVRVRRQSSQLKTTSGTVAKTTLNDYTYVTYSDSAPYADGKMMAKADGGSWADVSGSDMYFVTYSADGDTTVTQNSQDPSDILKDIIDRYNEAGGAVTYDLGTPTYDVTTNLFENPSFEDSIADWTVTAGIGTQASDSSPQGSYNFQLQNSSGGYATSSTTTNLVEGNTYTVSYYAKWAGSSPTGSVTGTHDSTTVFTNNSLTTSWVRYSHEFEATANDNFYLAVDISGADRIISIDGLMLTEGGLVDYFDGDTTDTETMIYDWTGTANDSTSTRSEIISTSNASIDDTSTSVSYTFVSQNTLDCINKVLELAPSDWYYYIDPATNIIHFHEKATTADHNFVLGKDIKSMSLDKRTQNIVNQVYFTGGDTGGGSILYKKYSNDTSIGLYGLRSTHKIDGRVINADTAQIMANRILDNHVTPEVRLQVVVSDSNLSDYGYNIEGVSIGDILNIRNADNSTGSSFWNVMTWNEDYWNYSYEKVGSLYLLVVRMQYKPDSLFITCSTVPPQVNKRIEDIERNLTALQTKDNPSAPS